MRLKEFLTELADLLIVEKDMVLNSEEKAEEEKWYKNAVCWLMQKAQ